METKAFLLVVGNDKAAPEPSSGQELGVSERVLFAGVKRPTEIYPPPIFCASHAV